jgi:hypothetical protein
MRHQLVAFVAAATIALAGTSPALAADTATTTTRFSCTAQLTIKENGTVVFTGPQRAFSSLRDLSSTTTTTLQVRGKTITFTAIIACTK